MRTVCLNKKDISRGYLILVNNQYELPKDFQIPACLSDDSSQISLERTSLQMLSLAIDEIHAKDSICLVSGLRDYDEQAAIYDQSIKEQGIEFTHQYVAKPNQSEHQTGLAIDLAYQQEHIDMIRPEFPYMGICQQLREKLVYYGFIERYQKDKEQMTHIAHEPWHFRYVGFPHSFIMHKHNMCLEEYHEWLKHYSIFAPYVFAYQDKIIEICYVPAVNEENYVNLSEKNIYQISGNNMDGFVITAWRQYA